MSEPAHAATQAATDTSGLGGQGFGKGGAKEAHPGPNGGASSEHAEKSAAPVTGAVMSMAKPAKVGLPNLFVKPEFTWQAWIDTLQSIICLIMIWLGQHDYGFGAWWLLGVLPLLWLLVQEDDPKWKLTVEVSFIALIPITRAAGAVDLSLVVTVLVCGWNSIDFDEYALYRLADFFHIARRAKHGLSTIGK